MIPLFLDLCISILPLCLPPFWLCAFPVSILSGSISFPIIRGIWDFHSDLDTFVFVMHRHPACQNVLALFMTGQYPEAGKVAPNFLSISDPRIGIIADSAAHHWAITSTTPAVATIFDCHARLSRSGSPLSVSLQGGFIRAPDNHCSTNQPIKRHDDLFTRFRLGGTLVYAKLFTSLARMPRFLVSCPILTRRTPHDHPGRSKQPRIIEIDHSPAGVAFFRLLEKKILPVKAPNFPMLTLWAQLSSPLAPAL